MVRTVGDVTRFVKNMFDHEALLQGLLVRGEVSNFKRYPSGHAYFTLKDETASLKCVMFKSRAQYLAFEPENGMQVIARGNISVYERDGAYQLYVEALTPEGAGALAVAFAQLKERLSAEGLFDEARKKPLPPYPRTIGIVTSPAGAVLRDIHRVAKRRFPQVRLVLYPSAVQGEEAAPQIAQAIRFFNEKYPVDVLIVGRGGGSAEDLWAFNEEPVVRAIAASKIPVISAVGHETDFSLSDFAADVRAATPSQAAELAVPDAADLARHVQRLRETLTALRQRWMTAKRDRLARAMARPFWQDPRRLLDVRRQRLDSAMDRFRRCMTTAMAAKRQRLMMDMERLELLSPVHVMRRGYGLVSSVKGEVLHSVRHIEKGDTLHITLTDGRFSAKVTRLWKGEAE